MVDKENAQEGDIVTTKTLKDDETAEIESMFGPGIEASFSLITPSELYPAYEAAAPDPVTGQQLTGSDVLIDTSDTDEVQLAAFQASIAGAELTHR